MKHHIIIRMTHTLAWLLLLCVGVTVLGCSSHEHDWLEASCTEPFHCEGCEVTAGEALGHAWLSATCTEPTRCSVCSVTQGDTPTHTWAEADCEHPQTCTVCGETQGEARGHFWRNATCETAQTCDRCGTTKGEPRGHLLTEANCTDDVVCRICKKTRALAPGHDWIEPTCHTPQTCRRCGLKTEQYAAHSYVGAAVCGKQRTCIECGRKEDVLQHNYDKNGKCRRCGALITADELKKMIAFETEVVVGHWDASGDEGYFRYLVIRNCSDFDLLILEKKVRLYGQSRSWYCTVPRDMIEATNMDHTFYCNHFVGIGPSGDEEWFTMPRAVTVSGDLLAGLFALPGDTQYDMLNGYFEIRLQLGTQVFKVQIQRDGSSEWYKVQ